MKTYRKFILAAAAVIAAASLSSCEEIKEGDRYIEGEAIESERSVLLVDFTGQNCINCPEAHKVVEQLEEQYGDKLIAVSIHCGSFGISTKRTNFEKGRIGLMTEEGQAIMETYGIENFPMGNVDFGSPITYDLWPSAVREALQKTSDVAIKVSADYEPAAEDGENGYFGNIKIGTELMCSENLNACLQIWIVESGIVAEQRTLGSQTIADYVHNNVFRAQLYNGLKGMDITLKDGMSSEYSCEIANRWTDKERWNVENMAAIAIVSDGSGVLQVARTPISIPEE